MPLVLVIVYLNVTEVVLTAEGDRTRLVLEYRGIALDELAAHGAGWQAHLEDLAAYLAGRPTSTWKDRWLELTPAYERLAEPLL